MADTISSPQVDPLPAGHNARPQEPWGRARPCLRIGVVGHTSDYGCGLEQDIRTLTGKLFEAVITQAQTAARDAGHQEPVQFRFLSCMAPGYDTWAAEAWLGLESRLESREGTLCRTLVLPEPRAAYRRRVVELGTTPAEVFDRVVPTGQQITPAGEGAESSQLPASLVEYNFGAPVTEADSISRDWQAARFLVHHCDMLIALWDGMRWRHDPGDKRTSCTFRSMDLARRMGVPILWIPLPQGTGETAIPPSQGIESRRLRDTSIDVLRATGGKPITFSEFTATSAREAVGQIPLNQLFHPLDAHGHAATHSPPKAIFDAPRLLLVDAWRMLFGRSDLEVPDAHHAPGGFQREQCDPPRDKKVCGRISAAWRGFMARVKIAIGENHLPRPKDTDPREPQEECIDRPCRFLDTRSGVYMGLYRGAFLLTYVLGPIAVISGALAYTCKVAHWKEIAIAVILVEFFVVISILLLHWGATTRHWHVRATGLRVSAELFRHTKWRWMLGRLSTRISPIRVGEMKDDELDEAWPQRFHDTYLRALDPAGVTGYRHIDSEQLTTTGEAIRKFWIRGQIDYHERTHCRNHFLNRVMESIVAAMFLLVVATVFGALCWAVGDYVYALLSASAEHAAVAVDAGETGHETKSPAAEPNSEGHSETPGGWRWWLEILILVFGVGCPAIAAAAHGLGAQAMFRVIAERSRRIMPVLCRVENSVVDGLKNAKADPSPKGLDDLLHDLEFGVEQASDVMLQELDDWQMDYHVQEPPL